MDEVLIGATTNRWRDLGGPPPAIAFCITTTPPLAYSSFENVSIGPLDTAIDHIGKIPVPSI